MAVAGKLGVQTKFYYNTGTYGSPTWTAITYVSELTLGLSIDKLEASARDSRGKTYLPGMLDIGVTFKVRKYRTDTAVAALLNAFAAVTLLDFLVLDGVYTTNTVEGWRFESYVYSANEDQGLGSVLFPELMIAPAPTDNGPPAKAVVSGGAPVFTSLTP